MHRLGSLALALTVLGAVLVPGPAVAQDRFGRAALKASQEFEKKKRKVLVESGHRHLELGVWCRNQGLVSQASFEFIRAVEVSEHRHPGAEKVLSIMRSLGDDFWKKRRRKTHTKLLAAYEKKTNTARRKAEKDRFGLAKWAYGKGLPEGKEEFLALLRAADAPLDVDSKGIVVLAAGKLPADLSEELVADAVSINDRLYVRDKFLALIPDVSTIHEVESERLRIRSQTSQEEAEDVLACCEALLPILTEDTGGRPTQRMTVFVFKDRKTYEAYLEAAEMPAHRVASGLAIGGANLALVNGQGASHDRVLGISLHELSHLFMYGVTRSMMPSWYSEGFAETYGGGGAFKWKDGELTTHGKMTDRNLGALKTDAGYIPLTTLFAGQALKLLQTDMKKAGNFYAESWAFVRFLRTGAGDDVRKRFETWEDMCRGKALGAVFDKPNAGDMRPSQQLFDETFGGDLDEIEAGFREFLQTL